jgi:hypothetical protein
MRISDATERGRKMKEMGIHAEEELPLAEPNTDIEETNIKPLPF